jgi:proteasome lid subunit RPN8/RPN11
MTIIISTKHQKIICDRAESVYPEECCGILLGKIVGISKTVVEVIPTINAWEKGELDEVDRSKNNRYSIDPQDIFMAQKRARDLDLDIIGFFHSHPDYPAIPSICDRSQAWEVYSYPIVSVINGKVSEIKSWVLDGDGVFQSEEIQIKTHTSSVD